MGSDQTIVEQAPSQAWRAPVSDLPDHLVETDVWTDQMVAEAGIPIVDSPFVSVGGGIGSLAVVDYLRIAGVPTEGIKVLTDIEEPWATYEYLTRNSQIPRTARLRSDSGSVIDNIWGFPSYAMREAWESKTLRPVWNVLTEPIIDDYYTPQAGQVFRSLEREAARIGWDRMLALGYVRMARIRHGGGYFVLLTPRAETSASKRVAYRCTYLHLGVGYPGVKFLDDLREYRDRYEDYQRVVNAYEPHSHLYTETQRHPTTVLVRGSGIVSSRVLQRLVDDRDQKGAQTRIIHLFRTYVATAQGDKLTFRRRGYNGFAYQGFNYPKGCWGGQQRQKLASLEGKERVQFLDSMGGTTTARRKDWREQVRRGLREGFYVQEVGQVESVAPSADGLSVITTIRADDGSRRELAAQFIIDATGLEGNIEDHRVLNDLLQHTPAGKNPKGRLDCERSFEVRGTRSGPGRMYASGSMTLGAYYATVDSFLGLQYSGLRIADDLAEVGFCRRIGTARSIAQWWRWARNVAP